MELLSWFVAVALLIAATFALAIARRARRDRDAVAHEIARREGELDRLLRGLVLSEESAARILGPGPIIDTITRIAKGAVDQLGVEGVCVFVRSPGSEEGPTLVSWGRVPEGMDDDARPFAPTARDGFGSVLSFPIRLDDHLLGELRMAERSGRVLSIREVQIARLLAQLIALAARNRTERTLREQAEEEKGRFILATTHDLRAPVCTIQQLIYVLRDGYAGEMSPTGRELLDKIHGRTDQLLDLLSDLLDLANEECEPDEARGMESLSLSAVFDGQVEAARVACDARGIEIKAERPDSPLVRRAARRDLEKILGNLLSNAVKYTPCGGTIEVGLEDSPGGMVFRVRDTGIGIPEDALPHLFTEYFRAPNAREMERHGTGLGLALVQKLVRKYRGRVRVESEVGKGTLFEILLPPS